jgi:hypothetical protein
LQLRPAVHRLPLELNWKNLARFFHALRPNMPTVSRLINRLELLDL